MPSAFAPRAQREPFVFVCCQKRLLLWGGWYTQLDCAEAAGSKIPGQLIDCVEAAGFGGDFLAHFGGG